MVQHLRILRPYPHVVAFYDGRIAGYRYAKGANWVDDGALSLGIASYAIAEGEEALVYDTHTTLEHAAFVRRTLEEQGVRRFTVVLSHWHLDHIAGSAVFKDCEIVANRRTADHLARLKSEIESGTLDGPPAIAPLILPSRVFDGRMTLRVGALNVELIEANIHSDDATVLWIERDRLLLAGDTMEDTVTYVAEPQHFDTHLADLDRLWALEPSRILPNHGHPDVIAAGGYGKTLIRATQQYIRALKRCAKEPELREMALRDVIAGPLEAGWVTYFAPYEDVHRKNVEMVVGGTPWRGGPHHRL